MKLLVTEMPYFVHDCPFQDGDCCSLDGGVCTYMTQHEARHRPDHEDECRWLTTKKGAGKLTNQ